MSRTGFLRPLVIATALLIASFVVGATPAYASHHRYATIYWERVLTFVSATEVQVKVTIEVGARWSFPWNPVTNPPVGTVLQYDSVVFDHPVKFNSASTPVSAMTFTPTVTSVDAANDTLYASQTFTLTYPIASNPIKVTFSNCCRVSGLLDGNNDQSMAVTALIDYTQGTRSPRSVSLPVVHVASGVLNNVFIPTVAFDNYTNKIRVATASESLLVNPVPVAPSVFSIDPVTPGLLHFIPRATGLYGLQLIVTSYDANGVAKSSVPLDFMLQADASAASAATVSSPLNTYTAFVGVPMTATVNATLSPEDATYTGGINSTTLPAGMTFTVPPHNGVGTTTGVISYTPTVSSTSSVVCFQSVYTKSGFPIITSGSQLCLTFNIAALSTTLTGSFVGVVGGAPAAVGNPMTVQATLRRTADNVPIVSRQVSFAYLDDPSTIIGTALTDPSGVATLTFTPTAISGARTLVASFAAVVNEFLGSTANIAVPAVSGFNPLVTVQQPPNGLVGSSVPVAGQLVRQVAPSGPVAGATVSLTSTAPSGATTTVSGVTNAGGNFATTITPTAPGVHSITAQYSGGGGSATSAAASFTMYQRALLSMPGAINGTAGSVVTVSATLTSVPQGTPIAGQTVTFSFGGVVAPQLATTDASGVATVDVVFPAGGSFTASASFLNAGAFYTNHTGTIPPAAETVSTPVSIVSASTSLANLSVPSMEFVGNSLVVSTMLARTSAPAGPLGGASVQFTLAGASTATLTATTDASGVASVTFPSLSTRGGHTVTATYAGGVGLNPSNSNTAPVTVYQRSVLVMSPAAGFAGSAVPVSAALTAVPGGTPLSGQMVSFSFGGVAPAQSAVTDPNGVATVTVTFPSAGSFPVDASFADLAAFFTDANGNQVPSVASATVNVTAAATSLATPIVPAFELLGSPISVATTLTRINAPSGPVSGATVTFTVTQSGGGTSTFSAVTDASGVAATSIPTSLRGGLTVSASFAGDSALSASASGDATTTVYQRTALTVAPATGSAGSAIALSASLRDLPANQPVAGQVVTFTFSGAGAPGPVSGTTNAAGVATVTPTFATPGTFSVQASFLNAGAFFTNAPGMLPPMAELAAATVEATNNAPTFTAPANISVPATSAAGATVSFTATGNDVEDGPIAAACTAASPSTFPLGTTTVDCTVTDAFGASASGSFTVTVTNNAPTFTPPAAISVPATSAAGATVSFTAAGSDLEDGPLTAVCSPASGSTFALGNTPVNCTVTDVAGAATSGSFTVTVTNNAPTFTPPANIVAEATSASGAAVSFIAAGNDLEQGALPAVCSPVSGSTFGLGTATVTCTVTDVAGAQASGSFTVTVRDTIAPVIAAHGNETKDATSATGAVVTFTAPAYTDAVAGNGVATCTPASGSTFPVATTTVTCTANDGRGNTATSTFTVTVTNPTTPGEMHGEGFVRDDDAKYRFEFFARERANGAERAKLSVEIDNDGRKKGKKDDKKDDKKDKNEKGRDDHFESRTVTFIAFSDDPTIRPGRPQRTQIDTVLFSGVGEWNGRAGYRYEAFAQDGGEPGRHRESIRVTIWSPAGAVVASFDGVLDGGNIQSVRIRH